MGCQSGFVLHKGCVKGIRLLRIKMFGRVCALVCTCVHAYKYENYVLRCIFVCTDVCVHQCMYMYNV